MDLAVHVRLAHTPRDELRVLPAEIDDEDLLRQYAFAHTASATDGAPHQTHRAGGDGERNSSSGRTRTVAFVASLMASSQATEPQKPP